MPPYKFRPQFRRIIEELWNSGSPRTLSLDELAVLVGKGAYGDHSKLSYPSWDLVEHAVDNSHRRLTERGRHFAQGSLQIPEELDCDAAYNSVPAPGSRMVTIGQV